MMKRWTNGDYRLVLSMIALLTMMLPSLAYSAPENNEAASAPTPATPSLPPTTAATPAAGPVSPTPTPTAATQTPVSPTPAPTATTQTPVSPTLPPPALNPQEPPKPQKDWSFYFGGQAGIGVQSSAFYLNFQPYAGASIQLPQIFCEKSEKECKTPLEGEFNLPLRIVLHDGSPNARTQFIRRADWDETSEYIRFIDHISYGRKNEPVYITIGALDRLTLGHGSMVNNFTNIVDPDHQKSGMQVSINTAPLGGTFFIDDIISPNLAGANIYARPFAFNNSPIVLKRLSVGLTLLTQIAAPDKLEVKNNSFVLDKTGLPVVTERTTGVMLGIEGEFTSVETDKLILTHYLDINALTLHFGIHIGTELGIVLAPGHDIDARIELRALGQGYIPSYISPLFEYSQYLDRGWGAKTAQPLFSLLSSNPDNGMGGMLALSYNYGDFATVGAMYEIAYGANNSRLTLSFQLHPEDWGELGVFYFSGNGDAGGVFNPSSGALLALEARAKIFGPFFGYGSYRHRLEYGYGPGGNSVMLENHNDWSLGAGFNYEM